MEIRRVRCQSLSPSLSSRIDLVCSIRSSLFRHSIKIWKLQNFLSADQNPICAVIFLSVFTDGFWSPCSRTLAAEDLRFVHETIIYFVIFRFRVFQFEILGLLGENWGDSDARLAFWLLEWASFFFKKALRSLEILPFLAENLRKYNFDIPLTVHIADDLVKLLLLNRVVGSLLGFDLNVIWGLLERMNTLGAVM